MKQYVSIPYFDGKLLLGQEIIAFDKLDGNNMRFEWSKKKGWYLFGTRHMIIDASHKEFGAAISLFMLKYAKELIYIFKTHPKYKNIKKAIVFCEWVGPHSFAGKHHPDDELDLILFDVNPVGKGIIPPREFIEDFGHLGIPRIIYEGPLTLKFIASVRKNNYNLNEGVVCKTMEKVRGNRIAMIKIKINEWLEKLRQNFGDQYVKDELAGKNIM